MRGRFIGVTGGRLVAGALLLLHLFSPPLPAAEVARPLPASNGGPLHLPFRIPPAEGGDLLPPGSTRVALTLDLASTYLAHATPREAILLDGESWMTTLRLYRGTRWGEMGIDIPWVGIGGGTFDGFIKGWHDFFGLPQGGRDAAPRDRIRYRYIRDGANRIDLERTSSGPGDLTLHAAVPVSSGDHSSLSLRGSLSLPTGSHRMLRGGGTTTATLSLAGERTIPTDGGSLGIWGSFGGGWIAGGGILSDMRRPIVGFGRAGIGWAPVTPLVFKVELVGSTPLYRESSLTPLSGAPLLLGMGGCVNLGSVAIDVGVFEDLNVESAADVALTLGVRYIF